MGVTAGQAAIFNNYAYYADKDPVSEAVITKPGAPQLPAGWTVDDVKPLPRNDGQHTVIFRSADSSAFYVAERGSANFGDVVLDSGFITQLPTVDGRAAGVKDVVEDYQKQYPGADFYLGGHSLGGDVMKQVSARTGLPAFIESTPARFSQASGRYGDANVIEMRDARDLAGGWGPAGANDIVIHNGADPERNDINAAHSSANMAAAINADPALRDIELGKPIDAIGLMSAGSSLIEFKIRQDDGSSFRWQNPDGRSTEPTISPVPLHTSSIDDDGHSYGPIGPVGPVGVAGPVGLVGPTGPTGQVGLAETGTTATDWFGDHGDLEPVMSTPLPPVHSTSDYADFDSSYSPPLPPAGASGIYNTSSGTGFSSTTTYTSTSYGTGNYDGANAMSNNIVFGNTTGIIAGYDYNHYSDTAFA